jgi:glutamate racemase
VERWHGRVADGQSQARNLSQSDASTPLNASAPVGIFDSGIGGLTVAHAIGERLPLERIHYFGDTAHMPYGERSPALVRRYAVRIARHLVDKGCKALVIACNTASANALDAVREEVGDRVPVLDVVAPVVARVVASGAERIGVVGTRATITSGLYGQLLRQAFAAGGRNSDTHDVREFATPLLAPLIEEGWHTNDIIEPIIRGYLEQAGFAAGDLDALILGCTHYPLASASFSKVLGGGTHMLDAPEAVAEALAEVLRNHGLASEDQRGEHRFEVSDLTPSFSASAELFFGTGLKLHPFDLWAD